MKKNQKGKFKVLISAFLIMQICLMSAITYAQTSYIVSGAGTAEVNGTYIQQEGLIDDKPWYKNPVNDYTIESFFWGMFWNIDNADNSVTFYTVTGTGNPTPPETGWELYYGADPPPTVTEESSGPPATATWAGNAKSNDWHDAGNWDTGIPGAITDVTIPAGLTTYPTIGAAAECNDISFGSNAANTATLLDNGYLTVNGTATVERYFTGNDQDWHLVSAPISDATANVFFDMYLQSFAEGTNSYTEISDETTALNVMEGYGLYSNLGATNTVSFVGTLNFAPQSYGFTASGAGWNLTGNPYVSSIDWETVTIPTGMSNEVHYIRATDGNDLSYVKGTGGTGSQYIPPHQGFFVSATAAGTLNLGDAQRTHSGAGTFYKNDNSQLLVLEAANENFSDQAWIHFNENAGEEHDGQFDAYKRISLSNPELPQIFSYTPANTKLSINGMPETTMVPVGFTAVESGVFTIGAVETGEFANVVLEDLFTQTQINLLNNPYTFNYTAGDQQKRFIIHFTPLAVPEIFEEMVNIFSFNTDVYITVPVNTKGNIFIYNMMGQKIVSKRIDDIQNIITLEKCSYYVVKVLSDENIVTRKVFIK